MTERKVLCTFLLEWLRAQIFALLEALQFLCHTEKNIRVTGDTESSTENTTLVKEVRLRKFHCIKKQHSQD